MRRFDRFGSGARARWWATMLVLALLGAGTAATALAPSAGAGQVVAHDVSVSAGYIHTCAVLDGDVKCWGNNADGQLGYGDTESRSDEPGEVPTDLPAVDLGTGRTATAVATTYFHTCALLDDGTVKCWGEGDSGALGSGDTTDRGDQPGEMGDALPAVDLGVGRTATAIAAYGSHTCALLDDGGVKCWGDNFGGTLGYGDEEDRGDEPGEMGAALPDVDLGTGRTATSIFAGTYHNCALLDDGGVKCWGLNGSGQLGLGDFQYRGDGPGEMGDSLPEVDLGTGRTATSLALGQNHSCARLDDGTVKCWGDGTFGALGYGDTTTRGSQPGEMGDDLPIVDLGTGRTATAIGARNLSTCAVLDDGTAKCWGYNGNGQLGQGDTANRGDEPGEMGDALPAIAVGTGRSVSAISVGEQHTCAVLDDASVKCWGFGAFAQLGYGDQVSRGDEPGEMGDALPSLVLFRPPTTCVGLEVTVDLGQEQLPTAGPDVILGTPEADTIRGLGGDDVICSLGGGDTVGGGGGRDRIFGGAGDDVLRAGPGGGLLAGNAGEDTLRGDKGNDTLRGGADNDAITGGAGNDVADGGAGDNTCSLAPGRDTAVNCGG